MFSIAQEFLVREGVLKFEHLIESPGGLVKPQTARVHLGV